jgi:hypothetical protein
MPMRSVSSVLLQGLVVSPPTAVSVPGLSGPLRRSHQSLADVVLANVKEIPLMLGLLVYLGRCRASVYLAPWQHER